MSRVTFYLLQQQSAKAVLSFTCRLTDKVWRTGMPVHIHASDENQCKSLDELLWQWREDSFIPHGIHASSLNDGKAAIQSPITIGYKDPGRIEGAILINLADTIPAFYRNFSRTCEIVDKSPGPVQVLRRKFREYKADGIQPETHNIATEQRPA